MKKLIKFIPLFCLYIACLSCLQNNNLYAQQSEDSLAYYYDLVFNQKKSSDLPLAYTFYKNKKKQSIILKDSLSTVQDLRMLAIIENRLGFLHESEGSSVEALKLLDNLTTNDITIEARIGIYNQLGIANRALLEYDKALEYYDKILKIAQTPHQINVVQNNKAYIFGEQKKFDLAANEFKKVYENSLVSTDIKQTARALGNLGLAQSKLNHPDALPNIMKALDIRLKENDYSGIYSSYKHLTVYYKDRNNKNRALYYADMAYDVAESINSVSYKLDALSIAMDLNDNAKVVEYKRLSDSINLYNQLSENKYASKKYDYSEKERLAQEAEIKFKDSELQKAIEHKEKLIYQSIGIIILILSIFTYFILVSRHKKEKLQKVYQTETRISKKIHDEVANDLYQVMTKLQYGDNENKELLLDDLDDIYNRTRDISREIGIIDLSDNFETQINDLLISFKSSSTNIITKNISSIDWDKLSKLKKMTIYRVFQELLVNMKKHSKANNVIFSFDQKGKKLSINYVDNGIGCELKKQSGLINTGNRIQSINGTITFETELNKGFKVKINI